MIPPVELPPDLLPVIDWWADLRAGVSELSYTEIEAWSRVTGHQPSAFEVECIRTFESGFRARQREIDEARARKRAR